MKIEIRNQLLKPFSKTQRDNQGGMTIIEILIVIALIGTIMTIVITNVMDKAEQAKIDLTKIGMRNVVESIRLYKLDNNRIPTTEEGLQALLEKPASAKNWRKPYAEKDQLNDGWGQAYQYSAVNSQSFQILSLGPDGELDSPDDISYPEKKDDSSPVSTELTVPVERN